MNAIYRMTMGYINLSFLYDAADKYHDTCCERKIIDLSNSLESRLEGRPRIGEDNAKALAYREALPDYYELVDLIIIVVKYFLNEDSSIKSPGFFSLDTELSNFFHKAIQDIDRIKSYRGKKLNGYSYEPWEVPLDGIVIGKEYKIAKSHNCVQTIDSPNKISTLLSDPDNYDSIINFSEYESTIRTIHKTNPEDIKEKEVYKTLKYLNISTILYILGAVGIYYIGLITPEEITGAARVAVLSSIFLIIVYYIKARRIIKWKS